jgi:hypothetical protein
MHIFPSELKNKIPEGLAVNLLKQPKCIMHVSHFLIAEYTRAAQQRHLCKIIHHSRLSKKESNM